MLLTRRPAPSLSVPLLEGSRFTLGETAPETFTIVVFYRGKHCPLCRKYLQSIQELLGDVEALGARLVAVSMDDEERARASAEEWGLDRIDIGYAMSLDTARAWSLYISSARDGTAEPGIFSEPGLAVIDARNVVFFAQVQSAPFTRPPMDELLGGLKFVLENNYPARGDLTAESALAHD